MSPRPVCQEAKCYYLIKNAMRISGKNVSIAIAIATTHFPIAALKAQYGAPMAWGKTSPQAISASKNYGGIFFFR